MSVAVAEIVGFFLVFVDGEFDFKVAFFVAKINKGKGVEVVAVGDIEVEGVLVETTGACLLLYSNHGVNGFCHDELLPAGWNSILGRICVAGCYLNTTCDK